MLTSLFNNADTFFEFIINAVIIIVPALLAIILHEVAHGYVAYLNGDDTAKRMGRLTLNPAAHLDLLGTLALFFIGIGWAKPVPINPYNFKSRRKGMITTALAGVAINFLMVILATIIFHVLFALIKNEYLISTTFVAHAMNFLFYVIYINLVLGIFNLIPVEPLDGFKVVEELAKDGNRYVEFVKRNRAWLSIAVIIGLRIFNIIPIVINFIFTYVLSINVQ